MRAAAAVRTPTAQARGCTPLRGGCSPHVRPGAGPGHGGRRPRRPSSTAAPGATPPPAVPRSATQRAATRVATRDARRRRRGPRRGTRRLAGRRAHPATPGRPCRPCRRPIPRRSSALRPQRPTRGGDGRGGGGDGGGQGSPIKSSTRRNRSSCSWRALMQTKGKAEWSSIRISVSAASEGRSCSCARSVQYGASRGGTSCAMRPT